MNIRTVLGVVGMSVSFLLISGQPVMADVTQLEPACRGTGATIHAGTSSADACQAYCAGIGRTSGAYKGDEPDVSKRWHGVCQTDSYVSGHPHTIVSPGSPDQYSPAHPDANKFCNNVANCCCTGYPIPDPAVDTSGTSGGQSTDGVVDPPDPSTVGCGVKPVSTDPFFLQIEYKTCLTRTKAGYGGVGIGVFVGNVIKILLGILGIIFLTLLVYAGFTWMTAGGDEKKIGNALNIINHALLGLVITGSAFAITVYVMNGIYKATLGG